MSTKAFLEARSLLLARRECYEDAAREFHWPALDHFNWALDWFDAYAHEHAGQLALRLVRDGVPDTTLSFADLSERSNQVANLLRALGARRGDRMLVMLRNVVPTVGDDARRDQARRSSSSRRRRSSPRRPRRPHGARRIRHMVTDAEGAAKSTRRRGSAPASRRARAPGMAPLRGARAAPATSCPTVTTRATDPLLLYFTSGTTAQPKLVLHTHGAIPSATCPRCTGSACARASAPEHQLARLGEARLEQCLRAVERRRDRIRVPLRALRRAAYPRRARARRRDHAVRAADGLAHARRRGARALPGPRCARAVSAGEPLNPEVIERVPRRRGGSRSATATARPRRPARDRAIPRAAGKPGWMGRSLPGYASRWLALDEPGATPTRARSRCRSTRGPSA